MLTKIVIQIISNPHITKPNHQKPPTTHFHIIVTSYIPNITPNTHLDYPTTIRLHHYILLLSINALLFNTLLSAYIGSSNC